MPDAPRTSPAATRSPTSTVRAVRYEYEVRTPPPWLTVIVSFPATTPENVTIPPPAAVTRVPGGAAMSMPQWPPYAPVGANPRTTSPGGNVSTQGRNNSAARINRSIGSGEWPRYRRDERTRRGGVRDERCATRKRTGTGSRRRTTELLLSQSPRPRPARRGAAGRHPADRRVGTAWSRRHRHRPGRHARGSPPGHGR
jgi:hypothetical protein